jgi:hypothetical protein
VTKRGYGVQIFFQDGFFAILFKNGLKLKKSPLNPYARQKKIKIKPP